MFGSFKRIADATEALVRELGLVAARLSDVGEHVASDALDERVGAIERELQLQTAHAEALILRAEEMLKQARRAEERERHHAKRAEDAEERTRLLDDEGMDPFERAAALRELQGGDAEGSDEQEVLPLSNGLADSRRQTEETAITKKWQR